MSDVGAEVREAPASLSSAGASRDAAASPSGPEAAAGRAAAEAAPGAAALAWTVHPAARSPARAAVVAGLIVVVALLAGRVGGSGLLALLAILFLGSSLRAFFLPRHYRLDAAGAEESGPLAARRRVDWRAVKHVQPARFGVWLDARHGRSRLLPARGLFLRTQGNRDAVLAAARRAREAARADGAGEPSDVGDGTARAA